MSLSEQHARSLLLTLTEQVTLLQELVMISLEKQSATERLIARTLPGLSSEERQKLIDKMSVYESQIEKLDAHMASIKSNLSHVLSQFC